ncbi:MAG: hypothetical protein GY941_24840 [Planctomycetes bacterium]|nr:hypothetical protein [Planctomycetota bacterium]
MKINESELNHELEFMHEASAASSFEDFWMFLSFAMLLIAFVLMGYISYLKKLEVDAVKKQVTAKEQIQDQQKQPDSIMPDSNINIYLRKDENGIYLTIGEDMETKFDYEDLAAAINSEIKDVKGGTIFFNVYSPGEYFYEYVMKVCFIVKGPDVSNKNNIRKALNLVFEEEEVE